MWSCHEVDAMNPGSNILISGVPCRKQVCLVIHVSLCVLASVEEEMIGRELAGRYLFDNEASHTVRDKDNGCIAGLLEELRV